MPRSLKKPPFIDHNLLKKVMQAVKTKSNKPINTNSRASTIIPQMVGLTICVHNGKMHIPVFIREVMVGMKLGMFSMTRLFKSHPSGNKKAVKGK